MKWPWRRRRPLGDPFRNAADHLAFYGPMVREPDRPLDRFMAGRTRAHPWGGGLPRVNGVPCRTMAEAQWVMENTVYAGDGMVRMRERPDA